MYELFSLKIRFLLCNFEFEETCTETETEGFICSLYLRNLKDCRKEFTVPYFRRCFLRTINQYENVKLRARKSLTFPRIGLEPQVAQQFFST